MRILIILGGCTGWSESLLVAQFFVGFVMRWLRSKTAHDKTNKMTCASSEDSDQPQADQRLRCALNGYRRTQAFFMRTAKTLIRLGGRSGWSESSLGAHAILLVLSSAGSFFLISLLHLYLDVMVWPWISSYTIENEEDGCVNVMLLVVRRLLNDHDHLSLLGYVGLVGV